MYHIDDNGNKVADGTYRRTDVDIDGSVADNQRGARQIGATSVVGEPLLQATLAFIMGPGFGTMEGPLPETSPGKTKPPSPSSESSGRTQPTDLKEQLAMEQAKANPSEGEVMQNLRMKDPRWPAGQGWVKMRQNIEGVEIHYLKNTSTGQFADFKFK